MQVSTGWASHADRMGQHSGISAASDDFHVPADAYGNAETSHAAVLHHWVDLLTA